MEHVHSVWPARKDKVEHECRKHLQESTHRQAHACTHTHMHTHKHACMHTMSLSLSLSLCLCLCLSFSLSLSGPESCNVAEGYERFHPKDFLVGF